MSTVTLDDLKHFWMPSGVPCFLADRENICDIVEDMGFQIYYIISNNKIETKTTQTNSPATANTYGYGATSFNSNTQTTFKIERKTQLFKVVNNFVGRVVSISTDELPKEFIDIEEECTYTMPLIPLDIVRKLDEFFRLVHSQHGTESIVILTYDTTKTGSAGWGVLVPEQTNTAAHCKYDADSIAAIKPDNVIIVGSVHSHPEMAAYASGTDHEDQADFDGVHITYGWQKHVNNGATQYYAELQMAGKNYKLDMEDVFETITLEKDPDPEVVEWSTKVKKAFPPYQGGLSPRSWETTQTPTSTQTPQYGLRTGKVAGGSKYGTRNIALYNTKHKEATDSFGIPANSVIATEIDFDEHGRAHCFICEYPIGIADVTAGFCDICETPLIHPEDHMSTIVEKIETYLVINNLPYTHPSYLYFVKDNQKPEIMKMNNEILFYTKNSTVHKPTDEETLSNLQDSKYDYAHIPEIDQHFPTGYMVCCGVREEDRDHDCTCAVKISTDDVLDFDDYLSNNIDLYAPRSSCHDCTFFYSVKCPAYREILTEYVRSKSNFNLLLYANSVTGCSNFENYTNSFTLDSLAETQYQSD